MIDAIGTDIEWSLSTGYDYDGRLERIEADPAGRMCLVVTGARKRVWMDDTNREGGAHECADLPGERWVPISDVVEFGPCGYPRGR